MPLVTITLPEGKDEQFIQSLSTIIHSAMVETINCPPEALYHIVNQVKREHLLYLPEYKGMQRSENIVFIQITLKEGRTPAQKKNMYEKISSGLNANLGIRYEDIIIILTDSAAENWYFGRNNNL